MSHAVSPCRRLHLQGTYNTRDLGGFPCKVGVTRFGVFLRSDNPLALTPEDFDALQRYGIANSLDLRSEAERKNEPSSLHTCTAFSTFHVSLSDVLAIPNYEGDTPGSMAGLYLSLLDTCGTQLAEVLRILLHTSGGTLYHCAVGKDRTGVVSMLLLALVGVSEEDIVADYTVSDIYMHKVSTAFLKHAQENNLPEAQHPYRAHSRAISMWRTLRHLEETYGGAQSYCKHIGFSLGDIALLQQKFVTAY